MCAQNILGAAVFYRTMLCLPFQFEWTIFFRDFQTDNLEIKDFTIIHWWVQGYAKKILSRTVGA